MASEWDGGAGRESLSARGVARRSAMLVELDAAMGRRNARRVAVRAGVAAAPLLLIAAVIWGRGMWAARVVSLPTVPGPIAVHPEVIPAPASFVEIVQTDPEISARHAADARVPEVTIISDAELQSLLTSLGRPSGIVRTGGRVILAAELVPRPRKEEPEKRDPGASS